MKKRVLTHTFSLLHVYYLKADAKWSYPNVISPYFRIYYIDEGEGFVSNATQTVKLEPGYLYMIPSYTLFSQHCKEYLGQYYLHLFEESVHGISLFENNRNILKIAASELDISLFKKLLEINPGRGVSSSNDPKVYEKTHLYRGYQELNNVVNEKTFLETQGIILQLVSRFLNLLNPKHQQPEPIPSKILETISYIQLHLKEDLTVKFLAQRGNQNQDYFSRLFLQHTGERPLVYIHQKRIERAQYLITTTEMSYTEIAEETGFGSFPHFSKVFKKVTSLTPGEYRKQNFIHV